VGELRECKEERGSGWKGSGKKRRAPVKLGRLWKGERAVDYSEFISL